MRTAKEVLSGDTTRRKWLTRKPGTQDFVVRYLPEHVRVANVATVEVVVPKPSPIGLQREPVAVIGKDALRTSRRQSDSEATDAGEQVNEPWGNGLVTRRTQMPPGSSSDLYWLPTTSTVPSGLV